MKYLLVTAQERTSLPYVAELLNVLIPVFKSSGFVLLVIAIGLFILSFRDESSESKIRPISLLVVAIFLIASGVWMQELLTTMGVTGVTIT